jgi:vancomycin resistance protein VanW
MITALRRLARAHLPDVPRLAFASARRALHDRLSGDAVRITRRAAAESRRPTEHCVLEIVQEIRNTAFVEGKLANIRLAARRLDGVTIAPGDILSFWALVGRPTAGAGFQLGRSIRNDAVGGEIGGGLCQVSGIAYELGLRAGLTPRERHPHSHDLYTEEERFTPLGLDATLVWPHKDLRLANPHEVPVTVRFAVEGMRLRASLHAPQRIEAMAIGIECLDRPGCREVRVSRGGAPVSHDRYAVALAA